MRKIRASSMTAIEKSGFTCIEIEQRRSLVRTLVFPSFLSSFLFYSFSSSFPSHFTEKIHQANAAAAKAKKLQKPRVPRQNKTKDEAATTVSEIIDPSAVKAVPSPKSQDEIASKPLEMKKPSIKIKIAGGTSSEHPKISVITSLQVNKKLTTPTSVNQPLTALQAEPQAQSGGTSKLNTAGSSANYIVDSPGQRFSGALNSADAASTGPAPGLLFPQTGSEPAMSESRGGSEGFSSENESSSGNDSSDDEDESFMGESISGKTKHGKFVSFKKSPLGRHATLGVKSVT